MTLKCVMDIIRAISNTIWKIIVCAYVYENIKLTNKYDINVPQSNGKTKPKFKKIKLSINIYVWILN